LDGGGEMDSMSDSGEHLIQKLSSYEDFFVISQRIKKTYDKMWTDVRKEYELTQNEIIVLLLLKNNPDLDTSADIAEYCSLSRSLVCKSVEELMKNGYLLVKTDRKDRRYQHLILTSNADKVLSKLQQMRERLWSIQKEGITEEEIDAFYLVLLKMRRNLEKVKNIKERGVCD